MAIVSSCGIRPWRLTFFFLLKMFVEKNPFPFPVRTSQKICRFFAKGSAHQTTTSHLHCPFPNGEPMTLRKKVMRAEQKKSAKYEV
jgi:hypothetical protein